MRFSYARMSDGAVDSWNFLQPEKLLAKPRARRLFRVQASAGYAAARFFNRRLSTENGRLVCLPRPIGQRGFVHFCPLVSLDKSPVARCHGARVVPYSSWVARACPC